MRKVIRFLVAVPFIPFVVICFSIHKLFSFMDEVSYEISNKFNKMPGDLASKLDQICGIKRK